MIVCDALYNDTQQKKKSHYLIMNKRIMMLNLNRHCFMKFLYYDDAF